MQSNNGSIKKGALEIVRGVLVTLCVSLVAVLALALLMRFSLLSDGAVKFVNQFVKLLGVFIGCYTSLRGGKGLIKGIICGVAGILLTFFVFALISGSARGGISLLWDVLFGAIVGGGTGIVAVNLKKQ